MRIEGLKQYCYRNPHGYFQDLPWKVRNRAYCLLHHFCHRWGHNLPQWRLAILIGQAKWLALNPPTSEWGRSMLAKRGGYAVQRRYLIEGRTGSRHPAHRAALVSASRRKWRKQVKEELRRREYLGLPPKPRFKYLPL